jgi:outer membrane protein assembly factor BamB
MKHLFTAALLLSASGVHATVSSDIFVVPIGVLSHPDGDRESLGAMVAGDGTKLIAADSDTTARAFLFDLSTAGPPIELPSYNLGPGGYDDFDLRGDFAVIGAEGATTPDDTSKLGRVFVFDSTTGDLVYALKSPTPDTARPRGFGITVAIAGDKLFVGDWRDDRERGTAYAFDLASGAFLYEITQPEPVSDGRFGYAISAAGDDILISRPGVTGAAYLFDGHDGSLLQTFNGSTDEISFGNAVAGNGSTVLIADPNASPSQRGEAFLFDALSGNLIREIDNPGVSFESQFGRTVAMNEKYALLRTQDTPPEGENKGVVYLIDAQTGVLLDTIQSPTTRDRSYFGMDMNFLTDDVFAVATGGRGEYVHLYRIVPEPSSMTCLALAGLLIRRRRR